MKTEKFVLNGVETIELPVVTMSNGITIRLFDPYNTRNSMAAINQLYPMMVKYVETMDFKTIVVPATKPVPIAYFLSLQLGMINLVVLKKEIKPYYTKFKEFVCKSITSDYENTMYITEEDYNKLNNRKVLFFDDVLSTGSTYDACKKFLYKECNIVDLKSFFVFKEGTSYKDTEEIKYLGELPI